MRYTLSAFAAVLLWGVAPVVLKSLVAALPGAALSIAIYALVACMTLPWLVRAWRQGGISPYTWWRLAAVGFMLTTAFNLLVSIAAPGVRGTTIGAIVALEPLMIALIAAALARRWPPRSVVAALLLSLAGVWLLVTPDSAALLHASGDAPWAVGLVVLGAALWSFAVVLAAHLSTPWTPLQTSMVMLCTGSLPFLMAAPFLGAWPSAVFSTEVLGGLIFMAVGTTVLANVLWLFALRAMGAVSTSLLINLVPLTTVSLSVLWLGESWSKNQLIGCVLVVTSLMFQPLLKALSLRRTYNDTYL